MITGLAISVGILAGVVLVGIGVWLGARRERMRPQAPLDVTIHLDGQMIDRQLVARKSGR